MIGLTLVLMAFFAITFIQSGIDKIMDWNGNIGWLKEHFSKTILKNFVPLSLLIILALEIATGIIAIYGAIDKLRNDSTEIANIASILASVTLLILLFGQRLAKDYDGARTIVIYLIPTLFGVYYL
jgi:uncharacterized membrane protein YphA (DoxX/SURF4 family)